MNENNVINALNSYDGTQPSLEKTVSVLSTEVGPDWMDKVFEQLGDLPVELKEKLDHVFNYYASLMAWNEAQSYLSQDDLLDSEMMNERLPILNHWLDFFGKPGQDLYQQLEARYQEEQKVVKTSISDDQEKLNDLPEVLSAPTNSVENSNDQQEEFLGDNISDFKDIDDEIKKEEYQKFELNNENFIEENHSEKILNENFELGDYQEQDGSIAEDNTPEGFAVRKAEREIILLNDLQSWLAARCLQIGNIEAFAYPYYGLIVDLMRQVVKDIQVVLDMENKEIISKYYPDGLEELIRKKEAVETDIQTAIENCESDTTALIEKDMDLNKIKKTLGDLDTSTEKEYLGPAPDGFELLDDKPIDEEAVKEQYEKLEETTQKNVEEKDISVIEEKNTSQKEQNGVQRKLSFSLKPKKG